jgi:hypothetical protein
MENKWYPAVNTYVQAFEKAAAIVDQLLWPRQRRFERVDPSERQSRCQIVGETLTRLGWIDPYPLIWTDPGLLNQIISNRYGYSAS